MGLSAYWNRFLDAPNAVLTGSGVVLGGVGVALQDWPFAIAGGFMAGVGISYAGANRLIARRRVGEVCRVRAEDAIIAAATRIDPLGDAEDVASARIALRALVLADPQVADAARANCLRSAGLGAAGMDGWLDAAVEIAGALDDVGQPV